MTFRRTQHFAQSRACRTPSTYRSLALYVSLVGFMGSLAFHLFLLLLHVSLQDREKLPFFLLKTSRFTVCRIYFKYYSCYMSLSHVLVEKIVLGGLKDKIATFFFPAWFSQSFSCYLAWGLILVSQFYTWPVSSHYLSFSSPALLFLVIYHWSGNLMGSIFFWRLTSSFVIL